MSSLRIHTHFAALLLFQFKELHAMFRRFRFGERAVHAPQSCEPLAHGRFARLFIVGYGTWDVRHRSGLR